jgi:hypothetical protein
MLLIRVGGEINIIIIIIIINKHKDLQESSRALRAMHA